jgi:hypothetical protein
MLEKKICKVSLFIVFLFFSLFSFTGLIRNSFAQNYVPGELIIEIRKEFLPINVTFDPDSNIVTSLGSIDSLNKLFQCYAFEKLYKGKWSPVQGL